MTSFKLVRFFGIFTDGAWLALVAGSIDVPTPPQVGTSLDGIERRLIKEPYLFGGGLVLRVHP